MPQSAFNDRKHSPSSSKPSWCTTPQPRPCWRARTLPRYRRTLCCADDPSVTRCSKADNHPQRLQGWRSCVHIVPDVSCDFSCHEPALDTTVLHVNEPATNHLGARTQCCSRDHEQHILRTQRAKLSFGPLAPFVCPAVRWSSGCTQTSEASARPHSELCNVSKHFQTVQLLSPLLVLSMAHGRVALHRRTLNQCSLLPSRLDFAEDECQRCLLIGSQQNLDV